MTMVDDLFPGAAVQSAVGRPRRLLVVGATPADEPMLRELAPEIQCLGPHDAPTLDATDAVLVLSHPGTPWDARLEALVERLAPGGRLLLRTRRLAEDLDATFDRLGLERLHAVPLTAGRLHGAPWAPLPDLAPEHLVVARRPPTGGPLRVVVGMLTMNEAGAVEPMIDAIRAELPEAPIVLVDSSSDATPDLAAAKGAEVLRQLPPRGHGPAMELLMRAAADRGDALVYLDCDFTYPPRYLRPIVTLLEAGADVVNGARTRRRPASMPLPNYLANRAFVAASRLSNGVPVADLHSGMRGYRSSVLRAFAFDGRGDALPIDTLLWPARCGYRVVEFPIEYDERVGPSKLRKLHGTVWTFLRLARTLGVGGPRSQRYDVRDGVTP